jgi:hypothetical protein
MKVLSVLLPAAFTRDRLFRDTHFRVKNVNKFVRQIQFVQFAIETVQPAGRGQRFFRFHDDLL